MTYRWQKDIPDKLTYDLINSPAGKLLVAWNDQDEICRAHFLLDLEVEHILRDWQSDWLSTEFVKGKFKGKLEDKQLLLIGTPFQQLVWKAVLKVPPGTTSTYSKIALAIGRPKAARPLGTACSNNPLHYLVPCHRILHSDGSLCCGKNFHSLQEKLLKDEGAL